MLNGDYWELPEEIREKLFARIIQFLSGDQYRPRQSAVDNCLTRTMAVNSATISNFVVQKGDNNCVRIYSDPKKKAISLTAINFGTTVGEYLGYPEKG